MGRQPTKSQFSVPRLEPALERGLKPVLSLGTAEALDKEVRISTEVLGRGKCDRVDSVLHNDVPRAWKACDPVCQRANEAVEAPFCKKPDWVGRAWVFEFAPG